MCNYSIRIARPPSTRYLHNNTYTLKLADTLLTGADVALAGTPVLPLVVLEVEPLLAL